MPYGYKESEAKDCPFAEAHWYDPKEEHDFRNKYVKGCFSAIYCIGLDTWCDKNFNYKLCEFYHQKYEKF